MKVVDVVNTVNTPPTRLQKTYFKILVAVRTPQRLDSGGELVLGPQLGEPRVDVLAQLISHLAPEGLESR